MNKKELKKWAEELRNDAKGYLDDFIKNEAKEWDIKSIKEFSNAVGSGDMYEVRIYDLALYETMNRLLDKLDYGETE